MSARFLLGLFDSIYVLALTAWVGSILFFTFIVAPLIFAVLGTDAGDKFVRALFPRYYAWGAIAGAVALPSYVAVPLCYPEYRGPIIGIQAMILLGCIVIMLYAGNSLTPAINAARDAGPEGKERFERLHRRSVWLNALVLAAGSGLLVAFATRPAPRTSGISELTAGEKARFDADLDRVLEQVERKYGFRRGMPDDGSPGKIIGKALTPEMVDELETYYAQKHRRDLERRGVAKGGISPDGTPGPEAKGSGQQRAD